MDPFRFDGDNGILSGVPVHCSVCAGADGSPQDPDWRAHLGGSSFGPITDMTLIPSQSEAASHLDGSLHKWCARCFHNWLLSSRGKDWG